MMAGTGSKLLQDIPSRVDRVLSSFFEEQRTLLEPETQPLLDELEAVVASGGKRLRPQFCYLGHLAAGGTEVDSIVRVGAALELLHTFALIHDDVMDRSPVRRGRLTSFRVLAEIARAGSGRGDAGSFGVAAAVLAGDLAVVCADRLLASAAFPPEAKERMGVRYDQMRTRAIAGQYLDLLAAYRGEADEATARRVAVLKSAGYTVADPLAIGALCADDRPEVVDALDAFGRPLGEAFQLRDDLLGTFGDPARTGKDSDGDLREGKQTFLLARARALVSEDERRLLDEAMGHPDLDEAGAEEVRSILRESGAVDAVVALIAELTSQAKAALEHAPIPADVASRLEDLADRVSVREA